MGNEVLAIDWKNATKVWAYTGGQARYDSSAAVNDKYVIAGSQDKKLHCINRQTGQSAWVFSTKGHVDSSPVIVGDRVFVGSNDGNVYGIGLDTGKEVWRYTDGRPFSASPAVGEGCLVIGSESNTGNLYCFGAK
jgi:outer membrane protein assembly factor BamB